MPDLQSSPAANIFGWPEGDFIFPVSGIDVRVIDGPHPYFLSHKAEIAANWELEIAANPSLYDGQMLLMNTLQIRDSVIFGECHAVPFSTLMLWRKTRSTAAIHLFGQPVIVSSDGAVIAIRMGQHTANPGRVYCASGSLDLDDIRNGHCDLDGNMAREVLEETGLSLADAMHVSGYHGLHDKGIVTVFRAYHFAAAAAELIEQIAAHIAGDPKPEIDTALAIRSDDPGLYDYPRFMPLILSWVFKTPR